MSLIPALLVAAAFQQAAPAPEVTIEPSNPRVEVDQTLDLNAVLVDETGGREAVDETRLRWFVVEGNAVQIDPLGRVTGVEPGRARIAAVTGQAVGFTEVVVPDLPATRIELSMHAEPLLAGTSAPLIVTGTDRLGDVVEDPTVTFRSSDPSVAGVDEVGRIFARTPGTVRIEASSPTADASLTIEVAPAEGLAFELRPGSSTVRTGDVLRFQVSARDASSISGSTGSGDGTGSSTSDGSTDAPRTLRPAWSVTGAGAAIREEGTDGVFVAEEPGRYRVTALIGEEEVRTAMVTVEPREYESALSEVGRGPIDSHHSGDMWAFEGVDGRDYAYVGTFMHDQMMAWDVTDPSAPVLTDSVRVDARRINDVKIHPNRRVGIITREGASDRRNGIVLLDLSDPAHPAVLSEYEETVTGGVHNVWIDGENELVYAAHNGTMDLHILDISDPERVQEVGRWGLDRQVKTLHDVIVQDGYAYLSYWDDGLVILDVGAGSHGGTPTSPSFVSRISYPEGNTHVAWRHGDYVFVGDEIFPDDWNADRPVHARGFIHVIDVSDIENPREVAWYEVPEAGAHNMWIEGDRMYLGYYQAGLRVVDISGELRGDLYAQGREVARYLPIDEHMVVPNWPMTWGAQLFKGNLFSSDLNSGLWITRLDEPGSTVF